MVSTINFTSNGITIPADLYTPDSAASAPGFIAIAYGTDGMLAPWGAQITGYAEALLLRGFVVMIPNYFASTGTTAGPGVFEEIMAHREIWQQALADAVSFAKANLGVDGSRVGLLGFSLGGHLCLRQRSLANILVEFFAPELDGLGSSAGLTTHAQIHHGLADQIVPFHPNTDDIKGILEKEGVTVDLFSYPDASHGFIGTETGNTNARTDSMQRTLDCFEKYL